ncbi:MAG: GGDEF domain-containing protein [Thiobacillaceae bacterium]|jgi:diguanylate cyclase|nr:GGDEF domain-containing protein [Thiobacillaceae bacterium]
MIKNPEPSESFEQARAYAGKTIDLLLTHRIAPSPPHYAVGYTYWSGGVSEIRRTLDEMLQAGRSLDELLLRDLYDRFIVPDQFDRYRGMRSGLQQILQAMLQALQTASCGAAEFRDVLETNIRHLGAEPDAQTLQAIAAELLSAATLANERNQHLQHDLVTTQKEMETLRDELEQHRRAAMIDPLTGLFNRRAMQQLLQDLLAEDPPPPLTMLLLDIDHFKHINDSYGHAVGDVVIRHVADTLRKSIRGEDIGVRYGGEEFIVLLPRTGLEGAVTVAEAIRGRVAALRLVRRQDNYALDPFTISIGVAERRHDDDQESLFHRADQALYLSKSEGRNRVTAETRLACQVSPEGPGGTTPQT